MDKTSEQFRRAAACRTAEELLALAGTEGISMTGQEARDMFARLHPPLGELADQELDAVTGGGCGGGSAASGGSVPLIPGYTVLSLGNQSRCMDCGHQDTFTYRSGHYSGGVLVVGTMSCPACKAMHQAEGGTVTLMKNQDGSVQRAPDPFGPVYA